MWLLQAALTNKKHKELSISTANETILGPGKVTPERHQHFAGLEQRPAYISSWWRGLLSPTKNQNTLHLFNGADFELKNCEYVTKFFIVFREKVTNMWKVYPNNACLEIYCIVFRDVGQRVH